MTSDNSIPNRSRKVPPRRGAEAAFAAQHSSDPALRETGIRVMGDMPWGTHLCVFFETKEAAFFNPPIFLAEPMRWVTCVTAPILLADAPLRGVQSSP